MKTIKTHGIEFSESELMKHAMEGKYIVKYNTVYQARYSKNTGPSLCRVWKNHGDLPLTKRGRFHVMGFDQVNKIVGFELLVG